MEEVKNFMKVNELVCFPKLKLGDRIFNYSSQLAGLIANTDNTAELGNGTPCESASNKSLQADSMALADGTEVVLDVQQANYLNDNGIITALNFYNGFVSWGTIQHVSRQTQTRWTISTVFPECSNGLQRQ